MNLLQSIQLQENPVEMRLSAAHSAFVASRVDLVLCASLRKWRPRSSMGYASGYQNAGGWSGHYYEAWVREHLLRNSGIRSVHKINSLELYPNDLSIANDSNEFVSKSFDALGAHPKLLSARRVHPDFLVETTSGDFFFLEVKSFTPTNGAVIYEAQLEGQLAYERFGIPVHYILIRHPVRNITKRFQKGKNERALIASELETPLMVAHFTRQAIAHLCENSGNIWIVDKRKEGDPISCRFKVLRYTYLNQQLQGNQWSHIVL